MGAVFARNEAEFAGAFAADSAKFSFGAGQDGQMISTALVQSVNGQFSQSINRLYDIGGSPNNKTRIYYVGGRAGGQASVARVLGPAVLMAAFYKSYGDVCRAAYNNITMNFVAGCGGNGGNAGGIDPITNQILGGQQQRAANATYIMKFCVLTQIGIGIQAQDMMFNESGSLMFSDLHYTENGR